ncbi:protein of unknown function DUF243 [Trinorchestia longiramus]|nr:protein of unknown function DUF243 [Trinorchestia longiramus]
MSKPDRFGPRDALAPRRSWVSVGYTHAVALTMKIFVVVISLLAVAAQGAPQSYHPSLKNIPKSSASLLSNSCGHHLLRRVDGKCVVPKVSKDVYLFKAPKHKIPVPVGPPKYIPRPKVHYNFVFVKTPDGLVTPKPLVIPPAKQKTLVYLLSQRPNPVNQDIIEVPLTAAPPEVFFVEYNDGDNTQLPGGIDLQTALGQSIAGGHQSNQVFSSDGISSFGHGDFSGAFASEFGDSSVFLDGGFDSSFSGLSSNGFSYY